MDSTPTLKGVHFFHFFLSSILREECDINTWQQKGKKMWMEARVT